MNRRRFSSPSRARRGVTLVELLVAMTILTIGMLSIVGISGAVARGLGEARGQTLAATAAQSRFERIAATTCDSVALNTWTTASTRGVTEKYTVTATSNNTREITDSVIWQTRRTTRRQVFKSLLPCRPGA
jgi:prepilin-type N-terminal cleavage/methylation domain-containing protein